MNLNHETHETLATGDARAEYTEPTLVRHGTVTAITQSSFGSGGDGGSTGGYTSSVLS